jgi:small subunit ribosomal protein S20
LATHKSAIKRARQNEARRVRNQAYKTQAKTAVKEIRLAIENNALEDARVSLSRAVSILQKVQSKGVIHKNTTSRKISRLTQQVNELAARPSEESKGEESGSPPQDPPSNQS